MEVIGHMKGRRKRQICSWMEKWVDDWEDSYPCRGCSISKSQGIVQTEGGGWLPVDGGTPLVTHVFAQ